MTDDQLQKIMHEEVMKQSFRRKVALLYREKAYINTVIDIEQETHG